MIGAKVLVTGATGSLGGRVARKLHQCGSEVLAHGRDAQRRDALLADGIRLLPVVTRFSEADMSGFVPDFIINCAGIAGGTSRREAFEAANITIVEDLVALAQRAPDCHLVHVSSPSVSYAPRDQFGLRESEPFTTPVSLYAWSRQQAEIRIRQAEGLRWSSARLRAVYGEGVPSMVSKLARQVGTGVLPRVRGGSVCIDLLHVDDAVDALLAIAESGSHVHGKAFNVAGPEAITFEAMVAKLATDAGVTPRWLPVPGVALRLAAGMLEPVFSTLMPDRESPLPRHAAGALCYSQTLDLSEIVSATGWLPGRSFFDHPAT